MEASSAGSDTTLIKFSGVLHLECPFKALIEYTQNMT